MTPEQVVRDFLTAFETKGVDPHSPYLAATMTVTSVNPPIQGGRKEFDGQGALIKEAMPDFKWGIQNVTTQGNEVTVTSRWTGTHTGPFRLSAFLPSAQDIPATGTKVSVPDKFVFTVSGDKITAFRIESPQDGGLLGMLKQLGVQLPPP